MTRRTFPEAAAKLRESADVLVWEEPQPMTPDQLKEKVSGISGLYAHITEKVNASVMDAAGPSLRVITEFGVGYDNIEASAATERGIYVGNTPGVLTQATADHAFALLMSAARRIAEGDRYVRAGRWEWFDPLDFLGVDVTGATLGVIGFGRIGSAVARRARGFEMDVIYHSRSRPAEEFGARRAETLEELLGKSDFVSIHVPLQPETRHLINAERLRQMKPGAALINTARGGVVDQAALYDALKSGHLGHAALDVTDPEPTQKDDRLLTLENVTVVPHVASATQATRFKMAMMCAENVLAGIAGGPPPYCVNPQAGERRTEEL